MNELSGNLLIVVIALISWAMSLGAILYCVHLKSTIPKNSPRPQHKSISADETNGKLREFETVLNSFDKRLQNAEWNLQRAGPAIAAAAAPHGTATSPPNGNDAAARAHTSTVGEPTNEESDTKKEHEPKGDRPEPPTQTDPDFGVGSEAAESPPYSLELVQQLYREWCKNRVQPRTTRSLAVVMAEYLSAENAGAAGATVRTIRDTTSVAEFVRFSAAGSTVGVVLPNPDATFTPVMAHLFPGLTRERHSDRATLSTAYPVSVQQRRGPIWDVV